MAKTFWQGALRPHRARAAREVAEEGAARVSATALLVLGVLALLLAVGLFAALRRTRVAAPHAKPAPNVPGPLSILAYGGAGDDARDNSTALLAVVAAARA